MINRRTVNGGRKLLNKTKTIPHFRPFHPIFSAPREGTYVLLFTKLFQRPVCLFQLDYKLGRRNRRLTAQPLPIEFHCL